MQETRSVRALTRELGSPPELRPAFPQNIALANGKMAGILALCLGEKRLRPKKYLLIVIPILVMVQRMWYTRSFHLEPTREPDGSRRAGRNILGNSQRPNVVELPMAKGGAPIMGATAASYTTPATTASDNGSQFSVVVSNSGGKATSDVAVLTVNAATDVLT